MGTVIAGSLLVGRYDLGDTIAVGGGATIVRAHDTRLDRAVAIKRPIALSVEAAERIRHEAAMLARCAHPGVVACLDVLDDEDGAPLLVMALVDGANLMQHARASTIPVAAAQAWAIELCRAVAHLHARGIVHGDLKPQHAIVSRVDGRVVLVDFDRAHEAGAAALASGAEAYAAPEVRAGAPTSIASDRYALGAVLRWLFAHTSSPTPEAIAIVDALLDLRPDRRPPALEVARALSALTRSVA